MIVEIGIFIISLVILLKGADWLIEGASDIAGSFHVSPILIGLSVVAFGTSLPEFIVSMFSAMAGNADFSFANVVGSNIANLGLGIGIAALMTPLAVTMRTLSYEIPLFTTSMFILVFLSIDKFFWGLNTYTLGRIDGFILAIIFFIFCGYLYKTAKSEPKSSTVEFKEYKNKRFEAKDVFYVVLGIVFLAVGGNFLVNSATEIALAIGIPSAIVAVTMVALGTSLPELSTTWMAVRKGHTQMAIGNIVGTNIFNILFVLGSVSLISPMTIMESLIFSDAAFLLVMTILFTWFASNNQKITPGEGIAMIGLYGVYLLQVILPLI